MKNDFRLLLVFFGTLVFVGCAALSGIAPPYVEPIEGMTSKMTFRFTVPKGENSVDTFEESENCKHRQSIEKLGRKDIVTTLVKRGETKSFDLTSISARNRQAYAYCRTIFTLPIVEGEYEIYYYSSISCIIQAYKIEGNGEKTLVPINIRKIKSRLNSLPMKSHC